MVELLNEKVFIFRQSFLTPKPPDSFLSSALLLVVCGYMGALF